MAVIIVDIVAILLIVGGIALVLRRPAAGRDAAASDEGDPGTYVRRIAGTMIAAFGLAIALMVTLFHVLAQG